MLHIYSKVNTIYGKEKDYMAICNSIKVTISKCARLAISTVGPYLYSQFPFYLSIMLHELFVGTSVSPGKELWVPPPSSVRPARSVPQPHSCVPDDP